MATIYQRGKSWYLQWREPGHHNPIHKSLGRCTKEEAETILHAKEVELRTGQQILHPHQSFKALALQYLNWHKYEYPDSHNRIYQIAHQHLIPFFLSVDIPKAEQYKRLRSQHVKPETVNKELRTLQAILNKGVEWGILTRNPIKSVKPIKSNDSAPHRFYSAEELERIYTADPVYRDVWRLLANTGLRRAEALALRWDNVSSSSIRVLSTGKGRTKSGKWRQIPLSPSGKLALQQLQQQSAEGQQTVVPKMTPRSLTRAFDRALHRSGLDGSLHCLRHTFCSHLVMSGVPLRTVQILAGHSSFKTTEIYANLSPDYLQDSVAKLNL